MEDRERREKTRATLVWKIFRGCLKKRPKRGNAIVTEGEEKQFESSKGWGGTSPPEDPLSQTFQKGKGRKRAGKISYWSKASFGEGKGQCKRPLCVSGSAGNS